MRNRIKKVKEFLAEGIPQFHVLDRRDAGKTVDIHVKSGAKDLLVTTLFPPDSGEGIIKIVERISDGANFYQSDMVDVDTVGSAFIIEFKEDRVHCSVGGLFDQELTIVEINQLHLESMTFGVPDGENDSEDLDVD